jgi:hypothetical protein
MSKCVEKKLKVKIFEFYKNKEEKNENKDGHSIVNI